MIYVMDRRRLGGRARDRAFRRVRDARGTEEGHRKAAVEALANEESGVMVALRGTRVDRVPLEDVVGKERPLDPDLYKIAEVLAELPE